MVNNNDNSGTKDNVRKLTLNEINAKKEEARKIMDNVEMVNNQSPEKAALEMMQMKDAYMRAAMMQQHLFSAQIDNINKIIDLKSKSIEKNEPDVASYLTMLLSKLVDVKE